MALAAGEGRKLESKLDEVKQLLMSNTNRYLQPKIIYHIRNSILSFLILLFPSTPFFVMDSTPKAVEALRAILLQFKSSVSLQQYLQYLEQFLSTYTPTKESTTMETSTWIHSLLPLMDVNILVDNSDSSDKR